MPRIAMSDRIRPPAARLLEMAASRAVGNSVSNQGGG
jgi:hypothetical protein